MKRNGGSLTAVGIGIRAPAQASLEASKSIAQAEKVFSVVADPLAQYWIMGLNSNTQPLGSLYAAGKPRFETYREMVEIILASVRENRRVCAVAYGHPGIFAYPFHESIRRARAEGYSAEMLAGISAEDCLFADLGIDPADAGCCSYEATEFLVHARDIDPTANLVLWQIGCIGESSYSEKEEVWNYDGLALLADRLLKVYRPNHGAIVYEAARLPLCEPAITRVELGKLRETRIKAISTLYVPPMTKPRVDEAMLRRLGVPRRSRHQ
jgi:precorrin-6B methylase 1